MSDPEHATSEEKHSKPVRNETPKRRKRDKQKRQDATGQREKDHWKNGKRVIVGIDEVGRGCMIGPVVTAACYVPPDVRDFIVRDSKALSHSQRVRLNKTIREKAIVAVGSSSASEIDQLNIHHATLLAMQRAYDALCLKLSAKSLTPDVVLVDGSFAPPKLRDIPNLTVETVEQGDAECWTIAAASIVAKVHRDTLMIEEYDKLYPQYKLAQNKGYGKPAIQAIEQFGLTVEHRRSFAPCRRRMELDSKQVENRGAIVPEPEAFENRGAIVPEPEAFETDNK
jgi:ribonuclease HII